MKQKTLVLDRKKNILDFSFNTLGSFIDLGTFNLTQNVVAQKLNTFKVHSKINSKKIYTDAYILDKKELHKELISTLDTNYVKIQTGVTIVDFEKNSTGNLISIQDKQNQVYKAKIFVDASGTVGVLSKKVGLMPKTNELATGVEYNVQYLGDTKEAHLMIGKDYKGGYGWIFPLKNKRAIIGFGTFDKTMVKGLKERLNTILELPNIKGLVLKDNDNVEGGSIPITPVLDKFVQGNLICVGDSVSQVNPIVGEGYKFIFESAIMASKAINKALVRDDLGLLSDYEIDWKKRFSPNYKRSKKAQKIIFSLTSYDFLLEIGMIMAKLRSNKKNVQTLSGEY